MRTAGRSGNSEAERQISRSSLSDAIRCRSSPGSSAPAACGRHVLHDRGRIAAHAGTNSRAVSSISVAKTCSLSPGCVFEDEFLGAADRRSNRLPRRSHARRPGRGPSRPARLSFGRCGMAHGFRAAIASGRERTGCADKQVVEQRDCVPRAGSFLRRCTKSVMFAICQDMHPSLDAPDERADPSSPLK